MIAKRTFDITVSSVLLVFFAIPMCLIAFAVKLTSRGPCWYWSDRVGRNNEIFRMPKFRTMRTDTPELATHELTEAKSWMTPIGALLRRSSLDELPQLISVVRGDMSLVGPRPALFNQEDLIAMRTTVGVHRLLPGITGWAQLNGRDEIPMDRKVALDAQYLKRHSLFFDITLLIRTLSSVITGSGIAQAADLPEESGDSESTRAA